MWKEYDMDKGGMDRRRFIKMMTAAGLLSFSTQEYAHALPPSKAKGKIVIVGAGAAGISMAARLQRWLDKPDITLIDPADRQYYQPGFTLIAAGVYSPDEVWKKQEDCIPSGVKWIKDEVEAVDPIWNQITTKQNGKISYDFLVLTPGLQINWSEVEGITHDTLGRGNAHSIYDFKGAQQTWTAMQHFAKTGGRGIFTDTYTKHKCGGAPKKVCLLTESNGRKQGMRDNMVLNFYTASKQLYDVPYFTPRLEEIYQQRDIPVHVRVRVKGVDTDTKEVHLEKAETKGEITYHTAFTEPYDFLHFTPPMYAPDFVRDAGLCGSTESGTPGSWVTVNKDTLVHTAYSNIISLGDVSNIPTSKTSSAIRIQVPVAARNLISLMEGKVPEETYNGYAACPIVTDYGHVLMCEFNYKKEPEISFPFTMFNMSREQRLAWFVKVYMLKPIYFHGMLKGRM